jgi:ABC-type glycerol-3-phosphate transport system substrate-binding protein
MFPFIRTSFYLLLILGGVAACTTTSGGTAVPGASTLGVAVLGTPSPGGASPTPSLVVSTAQPPPPTAVPDTPITLTLWLPTRFAPQDGNPAYQVLQRQLDDFARSADGTRSQIVIKQDRGPGGLLDLLRTASPVAPSVLPDVIALEAADLETAARAGLLKPIGSQLPANLTDDLFPFARNLGTFNGELYGLVYGADTEHLASNNATPLPPTWSALLDEPRRYLFVVGGPGNGVSDAVVAHYLSAGGALTDSNGQPVLDEQAVQTLLETYQEAQTKGILPGNLTQLNTASDIWTAWRGNGNTLVNLTASQFLSVETRLPDLQYATLLSLNKQAHSLGRGWAYAIVANDPRRQAAALRLLQHLLSPANAGEWTQAASTLPGRAAALTTWENNAYTSFLRDQLTQAQPAPSAAVMAVVGPPLRKAVEDVLAGRTTPAEAARIAALAVNPGKK